MKTKLFFLVTALSFYLFSCTSYRPSESYEEKVGRFQGRSLDVNPVPRFVIDEKSFDEKKLAKTDTESKKQASRMPANSNENEATLYSNKKLYFLTLLSQYEKLSAILPTDSKEIKQCPMFHTNFLDYKESYPALTKASVSDWKKRVEFLMRKNSLQDKPLYMQLPIKMSRNSETVIDSMTKNKETDELILEALTLHAQKNYQELSLLCEYGVSENYYTYENLSSYIKTYQKLTPSHYNLTTLYKISIFSNEALLKSIEYKEAGASRSIASFNQSSPLKEVAQRFDISWFISYLNK